MKRRHEKKFRIRYRSGLTIPEHHNLQSSLEHIIVTGHSIRRQILRRKQFVDDEKKKKKEEKEEKKKKRRRQEQDEKKNAATSTTGTMEKNDNNEAKVLDDIREELLKEPQQQEQQDEEGSSTTTREIFAEDVRIYGTNDDPILRGYVPKPWPVVPPSLQPEKKKRLSRGGNKVQHRLRHRREQLRQYDNTHYNNNDNWWNTEYGDSINSLSFYSDKLTQVTPTTLSPSLSSSSVRNMSENPTFDTTNKNKNHHPSSSDDDGDNNNNDDINNNMEDDNIQSHIDKTKNIQIPSNLIPRAMIVRCWERAVHAMSTCMNTDIIPVQVHDDKRPMKNENDDSESNDVHDDNNHGDKKRRKLNTNDDDDDDDDDEVMTDKNQHHVVDINGNRFHSGTTLGLTKQIDGHHQKDNIQAVNQQLGGTAAAATVTVKNENQQNHTLPQQIFIPTGTTTNTNTTRYSTEQQQGRFDMHRNEGEEETTHEPYERKSHYYTVQESTSLSREGTIAKCKSLGIDLPTLNKKLIRTKKKMNNKKDHAMPFNTYCPWCNRSFFYMHVNDTKRYDPFLCHYYGGEKNKFTRISQQRSILRSKQIRRQKQEQENQNQQQEQQLKQEGGGGQLSSPKVEQQQQEQEQEQNQPKNHQRGCCWHIIPHVHRTVIDETLQQHFSIQIDHLLTLILKKATQQKRRRQKQKQRQQKNDRNNLKAPDTKTNDAASAALEKKEEEEELITWYDILQFLEESYHKETKKMKNKNEGKKTKSSDHHHDNAGMTHPILETIQVKSNSVPLVLNPMVLQSLRHRLIDRYVKLPR